MTLKISRSQVSIQPNPTHQKIKNSDPTQPNPTHGWTQPMTNSGPNAWCDFDEIWYRAANLEINGNHMTKYENF